MRLFTSSLKMVVKVVNVYNSFKWDVRIQWRSGIYWIYFVISCFYLFILSFVPSEWIMGVKLFVLFSDPSTLGFFFIGALYLFEKNERVLSALFVTPVKLSHYVWGKAGSLTMLTILSGCMITLFSPQPAVHLIYFLVALLVSGLFYSFVGLSVAVTAMSIQDYFLKAGLIGPIFFLPFIDFLFPIGGWWQYVWPTKPFLTLFEYGLGGAVPLFESMLSVVLALFWVMTAQRLALARLTKSFESGEVVS